MNEHEMADLLDRATRDLAPDVEALVAAGLRRGQRRQRRRREAGAVAATVVAVVAIGLGSQLLGTGSTGGRPSRSGTLGASAPRLPHDERAGAHGAHVPPRARLDVTTEQVPDDVRPARAGEGERAVRRAPDPTPPRSSTSPGTGSGSGSDSHLTTT